MRLFYVKAGRRHEISQKYDIPISTREWFAMKVEQKGDSIQCYLNDKKMITAVDNTYPEAGSVGFWAKASAATSFDDFKMTKYR